jgi:hypothetical protein
LQAASPKDHETLAIVVHCESLRNVDGATFTAISKVHRLSQLYLSGYGTWVLKSSREAKAYDETCKALQRYQALAKGDQVLWCGWGLRCFGWT